MAGLRDEHVAGGRHGRQAEAGFGEGPDTGTARAGQAPRGGPAAIEVSHLTKVFGGRTAVSDVSFSVAGGEVFGFLGPNGAGKTTTVRILGLLISPTSGAATVAGVLVGPDGAAEIRQRIAVMPESPGLYQRLTVTENLEYFAPVRPAGIREADSGGAGGGRPVRPGPRPDRAPVGRVPGQRRTGRPARRPCSPARGSGAAQCGVAASAQADTFGIWRIAWLRPAAARPGWNNPIPCLSEREQGVPRTEGGPKGAARSTAVQS